MPVRAAYLACPSSFGLSALHLIPCSLKTSYEPARRKHGSKGTVLPLYLFVPCFPLIESMERQKLLFFHAISRQAFFSDFSCCLTKPWAFSVAFPRRKEVMPVRAAYLACPSSFGLSALHLIPCSLKTSYEPAQR